MIDIKKPLEDFWCDREYRWLGNKKLVKGAQRLTNMDFPALGDLAKFSMKKVYSTRGFGRSTMFYLIKLFKNEKIKTRFDWSVEKFRLLPTPSPKV
jgi:hypothetical protein